MHLFSRVCIGVRTHTPAPAHIGESLCQEPSPALLPRQKEVDPFPWCISSAPALQKNRPTRLCLCVRALSGVPCFWADPLLSVSILLSSLLSSVPLYGHIFLSSVHLLRDTGQLPVSAFIKNRCLAILFLCSSSSSALAVLELTIETRQTSTFLCIQVLKIKGIHHYA